ncbi:MAG: cytochrome c biogenesis protein CcsA [Akkermansiaceae bacterium]
MSFTLLIAAILAGLAGVIGVRSIITDRRRTRWTILLMLLSFGCQLMWLGMRGEQRASCPLMDSGEIWVFLAWSVSLFYLIVGSAYRVTLLGMFSAPVVAVMLGAALLPGMLDASPVAKTNVDYWGEMHSAVSVLSYGALTLGAISAVMFLVLDRLLKTRDTSSGLFKKMPPLHTLVGSVVRLTVIGVSFLTVGLVCGFMMPSHGGAHFWVAAFVWVSYALMLGMWFVRGMTSKKMSVVVVVLYVASLSVFAAL